MSGYWINDKRGFSLTELIVVIAIIGIALTLATLDFHSYQLRYQIDAQTKEMAADFNDIRVAATQKKKRHGLNITPTSYTFLRYSSETDAASGSGKEVLNKSVKFRITTLTGADLNSLVKFDERGYVTDINNIPVDATHPPPSMAVGFGVANAPNDCLVMSVTRVNMGKINGGVCGIK